LLLILLKHFTLYLNKNKQQSSISRRTKTIKQLNYLKSAAIDKITADFIQATTLNTAMDKHEATMSYTLETDTVKESIFRFRCWGVLAL
jgi:hypothetical protein